MQTSCVPAEACEVGCPAVSCNHTDRDQELHVAKALHVAALQHSERGQFPNRRRGDPPENYICLY